MADIPVPGGVERGAVRAPNNTDPGDRRANGYLPLGGGGSAVNPPNDSDRRGGAMPLGGMASPVQPPNHRFDVGMAKMPQPQSARDTGKGVKGDVPIGAGNLGMPASEMRAKR